MDKDMFIGLAVFTVQMVLIICKVVGLLGWSWLVVMLPSYGPISLFILFWGSVFLYFQLRERFRGE